MITAFISYSHDSDAHRERVLGLSDRLRADGVNTLLDRHVDRGWPRWMLNGLDAAAHVFCVCTERRSMINGLRDAPSTTAAVIAPDGVVVTTEAPDRHLRGSFLWDGTRCRPLPTPPGSGGETLRMRAGLASFSGVVYGGASYPSGLMPHVLLRRTVGAWEQFTSGTSVEPQVIAADGFQIFVAGRSQDPALRPNAVMRWTGREWRPAGDPFERPIAALELWNGQFIVGGSFTNVGPFQAAWLARWNKSIWEPIGPALNGEVRSDRAFEGELYVAGNFTRAGDLEVPGLAIWNGAAWRTFPAPPEITNLSAVAVSPAGLVAVAAAPLSRQRIWLRRGDAWNLISDGATLTQLPNLLWRGTTCTLPAVSSSWAGSFPMCTASGMSRGPGCGLMRVRPPTSRSALPARCRCGTKSNDQPTSATGSSGPRTRSSRRSNRFWTKSTRISREPFFGSYRRLKAPDFEPGSAGNKARWERLPPA